MHPAGQASEEHFISADPNLCAQLSAGLVNLHLRCHLSSAGIFALAKLDRLQRLSVCNLAPVVITQDHVNAIGSISGLQFLSLRFKGGEPHQLMYHSLATAFHSTPLTSLSMHATQSILFVGTPLTQLRHLSLFHDQGTAADQRRLSIPEALPNLCGLQSFSLQSVELEAFYGLYSLRDLSALTALSLIEVNDASSRKVLGGALTDLTCLRRLHIDNCTYDIEADALSSLTLLTSLTLSGFPAGSQNSSADILPVLANLHRLDLSGCGLERLPAVLTKLSQLSHLDLSHQQYAANGSGLQLDALLAGLMQLPCLSVVSLEQSDEHQWTQMSMYWIWAAMQAKQDAGRSCCLKVFSGRP